jgi:hypothetical protein
MCDINFNSNGNFQFKWKFKMKTKLIIISLLFGIISSTTVAQNNSIDYFGQTPPSDSAVVFASGMISLKDRPEYCIAFSPAGNEVCVSALSNFNGRVFLNSTILYSKLTASGWTKLDTAYFEKGDGGDMSFSPDGNFFTFKKSNPLPERPHNTDFYYCIRTETGWSQPQPFPKVINSEFREAGHSMTADRTLYFSTGRPKDKGCDVYRISCVSGADTVAEYVPNLSTGADEDGVWISPDESYAIIESQHDLHYKDLYISFHTADGSWTNLKNMGPKINFLPFQVRGRISPDGKYLFYTGFDGKEFDIYWIRADKIIADLKNEVLKTNLN